MRTTMGSLWTDNQGDDVGRKRAIEELVKGRDLFTQLKTLLKKRSESDRSVLLEKLLDRISRILTELISMPNSSAGESVRFPILPLTGGGSQNHGVTSFQPRKMSMLGGKMDRRVSLMPTSQGATIGALIRMNKVVKQPNKSKKSAR